MKLGTLDIDDFKVGSQQVDRIYLGSTLVWEPAAAGFDYDFTASETLPTGVTYARAGGGQGWTNSSGQIAIAMANETPWVYSGATLKGLFYRQAKRPRTNIIEPANYNPPDTAGWRWTDRFLLATPHANWNIAGLTTALETTVSDNQHSLPRVPSTQGTPVTLLCYANHAALVAGVDSNVKWNSGEILINWSDDPGRQFLAGTLAQPGSSSELRWQSLYRTSRLTQYLGMCAYETGDDGYDEYDIVWQTTNVLGTVLNGGAVNFDIADGTYGVGSIELGHDDTTSLSTAEITVSGGTGYDLNLADFSLTTIESLQRLRSL